MKTKKTDRVWKRIPYGNYDINLVWDGGCYVTQGKRYVGSFGNARIAENYINSLIKN